MLETTEQADEQTEYTETGHGPIEGPLSEEQVRFFREQGYLVVKNVLTPEELSDVRRAVDEASQTRYDVDHDGTGRDARYDAVFHQKVNLWQVHAGIRRHTFSPKIAAMARQLLGVPAVRLWHDQTLVKQPGSARPTPMHQDLMYWPMQEDLALTAWTPLDDVDEQNGCMQYVPRSHTWGLFPSIDFITPQDVAEVAPERAAEATPVPCPVPAGSVIFHHSLTFHGALPNVSERNRRAMIIHYMADGIHYNGRDHMVSNDLALQPGDPLTNDERWPVLG